MTVAERGHQQADGVDPGRADGPGSSSRRGTARPCGVEQEVVVAGVGVHHRVAGRRACGVGRPARRPRPGAASPGAVPATWSQQSTIREVLARTVPAASAAGVSVCAHLLQRVQAARRARRRARAAPGCAPSTCSRASSTHRSSSWDPQQPRDRQPRRACSGACGSPRRTPAANGRCAFLLAALRNIRVPSAPVSTTRQPGGEARARPSPPRRTVVPNRSSTSRRMIGGSSGQSSRLAVRPCGTGSSVSGSARSGGR